MVRASVSAFLATLDLDEAGEARAQIALALAMKLDEAAQPKASVGLAAATPSIAKELRDSLAQLELGSGEAKSFVADLFTLPKAV
jgi:hypothetical protein